MKTLKQCVLLAFSILVFAGCKKDKDESIKVISFDQVSVVNTAAMFNVALNMKASDAQIGIFISSTNSDPNEGNGTVIQAYVRSVEGDNLPDFLLRPCITGLEEGTTYYVKAYASANGKTSYSSVITIQTTNTQDVSPNYGTTTPFLNSYPIRGLSTLFPFDGNNSTDANKYLLYQIGGTVMLDGNVLKDVSAEYKSYKRTNNMGAEVMEYDALPYSGTIPCATSVGSHNLQTIVDGQLSNTFSITVDAPTTPSGGGYVAPTTATTGDKVFFTLYGGLASSDYACVTKATVGGYDASIGYEYVAGDYVFYFNMPQELPTGSGKQVYIHMPCSSHYIGDITKY